MKAYDTSAMNDGANKFAPELYQEILLGNSKLSLTYDPERNFDNWRFDVNRKFRELLGMELFKKVEPGFKKGRSEKKEFFSETRFVFTSEENTDVPCHLLVPLEGKAPFPVVICLQGHSTGMHISLGRPKYEGDEECIRGDRDFALQAVKEGYAALVLEQRCSRTRAAYPSFTAWSAKSLSPRMHSSSPSYFGLPREICMPVECPCRHITTGNGALPSRGTSRWHGTSVFSSEVKTKRVSLKNSFFSERPFLNPGSTFLKSSIPRSSRNLRFTSKRQLSKFLSGSYVSESLEFPSRISW